MFFFLTYLTTNVVELKLISILVAIPKTQDFVVDYWSPAFEKSWKANTEFDRFLIKTISLAITIAFIRLIVMNYSLRSRDWLILTADINGKHLLIKTRIWSLYLLSDESQSPSGTSLVLWPKHSVAMAVAMMHARIWLSNLIKKCLLFVNKDCPVLAVKKLKLTPALTFQRSTHFQLQPMQ